MKKIKLILKYLMALVLCITLLSCNNTNKDNKTVLASKHNIQAEGSFEEGSELVVLPIKEASNTQMELINQKGNCLDYNLIVYDISVQKDNVKLQVNDKVKITIDMPLTSKNGYSVFHFKSETEMEILPTVIENNRLTFETSSFSVFIIGENAPDVYNYKITYNLDGGKFEDGVKVIDTYSNESSFPITLPIPVKENYTFAGWQNSYNVKISEITKKMRGDLNLIALWQEPTYTISKGNVIFGNYPQSLVADEDLIAKLNDITGVNNYEDLTDAKIEGWEYLDYRSHGELAKNISYKDITFEGETYRGIYIKYYTQIFSCLVNKSDLINYQEVYGYEKGNVYWFKFEPIQWVILKEDKENGMAMLMSKLALDVKPFQGKIIKNGNSYYNHADDAPEEIAAYNWEYSYIRKWLNDTFYHTAFNDLQKEIIQMVTVDNSAYNGDLRLKDKSPDEDYYNPNTEDKIFLLSLQEFLTLPRFQHNLTKNDKYVEYADYYKAMGGLLNVSISHGEAVYTDGASYIFRTPRNGYDHLVWGYSYSDAMGATHYKQYSSPEVIQQNSGIVPVLWIKL